MQALKFLFILAIATYLSGCNSHVTYPYTIQQAESAMDTRPDSALLILKEMKDSITNQPKETQMYWQLLTIQAKDKLYITHTSDSLINQIVKFYEGYGDKEKLMLAYYYQGSVYRDMHDAPRALKCFQKTLEMKVLNNDIQIKAYNQMGTLFMQQGLYNEVIELNRKAIALYKQVGKENKASYAFRDLARMYSAKNQSDSALHYYKNACHIALADNDTARFYGILGETGGYYCQLGRNDSAKLILKFTEQQPSIRNKTHIYAMLGYVYKTENKLDSACYYYWKTIEYGDMRNKYHSYRNLFDAEVQKGNYMQAVTYIEKALGMKDSIDKITQTEEIAKINSLYSYQHTEAENHRLQLEQERNKVVLLGLLLVSLIGASTGIFHFFKQKEKIQEEQIASEKIKAELQSKYEKSQETIEANKNKIRKLKTELHQAKEEYDQLKAAQLQVQQKRLQVQNEEITLQQEEKKLRLAIFRRSAIYREVHQAAQGKGLNLANEKNINKWEELRTAIDTAYPNFTEKLHDLFPHLSDKETKVCILTKTGIPPSGIAEIMKVSRQNITNIRTRIYQKTQKAGGNFTSFDHFIELL